MNILLTNDDGIKSFGIETLKNALVASGHKVMVVAPTTNQSGCSHSMSFYKKLLLKKVEEGANYIEYSLSGTPTDCVMLAVRKLSKEPFDLVISGVNDVANSGTDILYSGTYNGAFQGTICGINSISISALNAEYIEDSVKFLINNLDTFKNKFFDENYTLNINVPNHLDKIKGAKVCPLGEKLYTDIYDEMPTDNEGEVEYFLWGNDIDLEHNPSGCDVNLLKENYITITPINIELVNNYGYCNKLKDIKLV